MKSFRKQFLSIFAISLVATLLLCPGNYSVPGGIRNNFSPVEVQAEEPTITDTQKGVALLMTILFAQGLRFVGDWNTVVQPGLEKLWDDFTTATGNAVTLPMIVAGSSLALGYIRTSNTVNNAIANFTTWYKNTFNQPTTGETTITMQGASASFEGATVQTEIGYCGSNRQDYFLSRSGVICGLFLRANGYTDLYCATTATGAILYVRNWYNGTSQISTTVRDSNNALYYYGSYGFNNFTPSSNYTVITGFENATAQQKALYLIENGSIADVSMTGESLELRDGYQLEQDQAKLYDISSLVALVAELALTLDNIEDLVRDIPVIFDTPWAEDFPDVPAYVDTPDDTIPWVTVPDSVIPADTPEYVPTTPGQTDSYKILGLERVFPFSIPFDLYYLTQIFVATPETPHFTYAIMNPATNQLLTQEFDLHWFDTLAAVIRTGETVAFLIFLIFVTRGLIRS